jgi:hypothetical protein
MMAARGRCARVEGMTDHATPSVRPFKREGNVVWLAPRAAPPRPPKPARRPRAIDAMLVWLAHDRAYRR